MNFNMKEGLGEIINKIIAEKTNPKKVKALQKYDQPALRGIFELAYDKKLTWALPEGRSHLTLRDTCTLSYADAICI